MEALRRQRGEDVACVIYATAPMLTAKDLYIGYTLLLSGRPYTYVPGLYYWGRVETFRCGVPLAAGYEVPYPEERYIDINTPEDWARAEEMYAALHGTVL